LKKTLNDTVTNKHVVQKYADEQRNASYFSDILWHLLDDICFICDVRWLSKV